MSSHICPHIGMCLKGVVAEVWLTCLDSPTGASGGLRWELASAVTPARNTPRNPIETSQAALIRGKLINSDDLNECREQLGDIGFWFPFDSVGCTPVPRSGLSGSRDHTIIFWSREVLYNLGGSLLCMFLFQVGTLLCLCCPVSWLLLAVPLEHFEAIKSRNLDDT